jgi:protein-tyrosine phosphatase
VRAAIVDCHCHLLPEIDDGPGSLRDALKLASLAVEEGITDAICTPHVVPGVYNNTTEAVRIAVAAFQCELSRAAIPLTLHTGAEIRITGDVETRLKRGEIPTLAEGRYVLLEPPADVRLPRLDAYFGALIEAGYLPIVAHPERLLWAGRHIEEIIGYVGLGAHLQVTAGSLVGFFGREALRLARWLLETGAVGLIASDAHHASRRPHLLGDARRLVEALVGWREAERIFVANPQAVLAGHPLVLSDQGGRRPLNKFRFSTQFIRPIEVAR